MFSNLAKKEKCVLITGIIGLILFIVSLVMVFVGFPSIIDSVLRSNIVLEEGTDAWDRFVKLPFPLNFKIYLFELQNGEDILNNEKPILKEVGPFAYKQYREKLFTELTHDNEYVSYKQIQKYSFDQDQTGEGLTEDYVLKNALNILLVGMYQIIEDSSVKLPLDNTTIDEALGTDELLTDITVSELLFGGIKICEPGNLQQLSSKLVCLLVTMLNLKTIDYKDDLSMSFSFFGFKNFHDDGLFKINTGISEIEQLGSIVSWNGKTQTEFWKGNDNECDKVHGLDSTIYPPDVKESTIFPIYTTDICTAVEMKYVEKSTFKDLDTYKFKMNDITFNNNDEESCYRIEKTKNILGEADGYMDGVMDAFSCLGIPGLVSMPYFLHDDGKYSNEVNLAANEEKHSSYLEIHPLTGIPTRGMRRAQINLVLRPPTKDDLNEKMNNMTRTVMPVLWIEEGVEVDDESYEMLTSALVAVDAVNIGQWVLVGVTAALCVLPTIMFVYFRKTK